MSLKQYVLQQLQQRSGEYISGQELAERAGKSRAAVWKAIKALQREGYGISAVTNRGYALTEDNDLISESRIAYAMKHGVKIYYYQQVDSTNTQAKRLIDGGEREAFLVAADSQTAGRGRQGKSFYSPAGTGIYISLAVHPNVRLQNAVTATTAAAVAVCRAIEKLTDAKPQIKWVNDVYCNNRKVCGILTEAITDFELGIVTSIVVGIGININTASFPDNVENAGALNAGVKRARLIAAVADELLDIIFEEHSNFIDYYRSRSMILGKSINYIEKGRITPAVAVAIDETGGLVVRNANGEQKTLRSGEISIRWQED